MKNLTSSEIKDNLYILAGPGMKYIVQSDPSFVYTKMAAVKGALNKGHPRASKKLQSDWDSKYRDHSCGPAP